MDNNEEYQFIKPIKHKLPYWEELPNLDLYMDQVIVLMENYFSQYMEPNTKIITPSMINNYVKLGMMPAPVKKKYSKTHVAYLIIICSLKSVLSIQEIKTLIDRRISNSSIDNLLNFYSDLFDSTINTVIAINSKYLHKYATCPEDAAFYMAIGSNISQFISKKIVDEKINDTALNSKKDKKKEAK